MDRHRGDASPVASPTFARSAARGAARATLRLSNEARACLDLAQTEARLRDDNHVGTEHIVIGLMAHPETRAASTLLALGITRDLFLAQLHSEDGQSQEGLIPLTPRANMILSLAADEADARGRTSVGASELLLGVIAESERWEALGKAGPHHLRSAAQAVGLTLPDIRARV